MKILKEDKSILFFKLLTTIADKTFKVFFPIIIYKQTGNLFLAALYLLISTVARTFASYLLRKNINKSPLFFNILAVLLFACVEITYLCIPIFNFYYIVLYSIIFGFASACYWISTNSLLVLTKQDCTYKTVRNFEIAATIGSLIAPLIGGLLLYLNGLVLNILICLLLYAMSIAVLLLNKKYLNNKNQIQEEEINLTIEDKRMLKYFYLFDFFTGLKDFAIDQIMPLFLAVNAVNFLIIGVASAVLRFGKILTEFISSYLSSKNKWFIIAVLSSIVLAAVLILFQFFLNYYSYITFIFLIGLLNPFCTNYVLSKFMNLSEKSKQISKLMANKEICIIGSKIIPSILILVGMPLTVCFFIGSGGYLLFNLVFLKLKNQKEY